MHTPHACTRQTSEVCTDNPSAGGQVVGGQCAEVLERACVLAGAAAVECAGGRTVALHCRVWAVRCAAHSTRCIACKRYRAAVQHNACTAAAHAVIAVHGARPQAGGWIHVYPRWPYATAYGDPVAPPVIPISPAKQSKATQAFPVRIRARRLQSNPCARDTVKTALCCASNSASLSHLDTAAVHLVVGSCALYVV